MSLYTEEKRGVWEVSCRVHRGKPLLVELPETVTRNLSAEDLTHAQVVAPYDSKKGEKTSIVIKLTKVYKSLIDYLHLGIEDARKLASRERAASNQQAATVRGILGGVLFQLRAAGCPGARMPDAQTGAGLAESLDWLRLERQQASDQLGEQISRAMKVLDRAGLACWAGRVKPLLKRSAEAAKEPTSSELFKALLEETEQLSEAARSLTEHKERFRTLTNDINDNEKVGRRFQAAETILSTYLEKLRFSEEDIDALTERFLDIVQGGKKFFGFRFDFKLDNNNNVVLSREDLEGPIQTGGGETQILGLLEMLAVATQFGSPIIIDEIENYLDADNLRKVLAYVVQETDVQIVLTSRDDALPDRLREWGIDHRAYSVSKEGEGYTKVRRMEASVA